MRNGIVYQKKNKQILFFVPRAMKQDLLHKYHNDFGHFGADKTLALLQETYWFPNMVFQTGFPHKLNEIEFAINNTVNRAKGETSNYYLECHSVDVHDILKEYVEKQRDLEERDLVQMRTRAAEKASEYNERHMNKKRKSIQKVI